MMRVRALIIAAACLVTAISTGAQDAPRLYRGDLNMDGAPYQQDDFLELLRLMEIGTYPMGCPEASIYQWIVADQDQLGNPMQRFQCGAFEFQAANLMKSINVRDYAVMQLRLPGAPLPIVGINYIWPTPGGA